MLIKKENEVNHLLFNVTVLYDASKKSSFKQANQKQEILMKQEILLFKVKNYVFACYVIIL